MSPPENPNSSPTRILLCQSYYLRHDPKEHRAMMPYPPLATLYAASYLRAAGYEPIFFDSMLASGEDEFVSALEHHCPDVVAIYNDNFNYLTKMCLERMRRAAFVMAAEAKARGAKVIVWSCDASDHVDLYLKSNADYIILGEGEQTLLELVDYLGGQSSKRVDEIRAIAYQDVRGTIVKTGRREFFRDLDRLPFPAWDLVDIEKYRRIWKSRHGYFSLNMITTRGCPFHCNWCAKPIYGQVYHSRSPENVASEMRLLKEMYHPDHIWFCDDIFGLKPGWVKNFSESVNRMNARIPFKCLARVDLLLKNDTIRDLKEAGCETVWVGAESGSQRVLDTMEKGTTVVQVHEATRRLHKAGIKVGFFLQFGYPGEMKEDIQKTIRMVKFCKPEEIGISVSYPLPGTKFYEMVRNRIGQKRNWTDSQDLALLFPGEYCPDFYRILHKVVHKEFRLQQGYGMIWEVFFRPWRINKKILRRIGLLPYYLVTLAYQKILLRKFEKRSRGNDSGFNLNPSHVAPVE